MYWNIATAHGGFSTWGWAQNSLVSVDTDAKKYNFNSDYYLLKHLTHLADVGSRTLETTGTCDDALAFANPDSSIVLLVRNELQQSQLLEANVAGRVATIGLPADSIGTLVLRA